MISLDPLRLVCGRTRRALRLPLPAQSAQINVHIVLLLQTRFELTIRVLEKGLLGTSLSLELRSVMLCARRGSDCDIVSVLYEYGGMAWTGSLMQVHDLTCTIATYRERGLLGRKSLLRGDDNRLHRNDSGSEEGER